MLLKEQNFGVEIELTGITRRTAASVIANYYGKEFHHIGTYYDTYGAKDSKGRTWKAMSDSSIKRTKKVNGIQVDAGEYLGSSALNRMYLKHLDGAVIKRKENTNGMCIVRFVPEKKQ